METKILYFDGTMRVSSGKITFKNQIENIVGFQQTNEKRSPGEEIPDQEMRPDVVFVFKTKESIDAVIRVLEHAKRWFVEKKT